MFQRRVMIIGSSFFSLLHEWLRARQTDSFPASPRPDYKQLSGLRLLYPHVPILALSATCPPDVLRDLIAILRLPLPTDGRGMAASPLPSRGSTVVDRSFIQLRHHVAP